jgi:hypothetical protein
MRSARLWPASCAGSARNDVKWSIGRLQGATNQPGFLPILIEDQPRMDPQLLRPSASGR